MKYSWRLRYYRCFHLSLKFFLHSGHEARPRNNWSQSLKSRENQQSVPGIMTPFLKTLYGVLFGEAFLFEKTFFKCCIGHMSHETILVQLLGNIIWVAMPMMDQLLHLLLYWTKWTNIEGLEDMRHVGSIKGKIIFWQWTSCGFFRIKIQSLLL